MRHALAALLLLATAACATGPKPLAKPDGQIFKLNPERWGETTNDLHLAGRPL